MWNARLRKTTCGKDNAFAAAGSSAPPTSTVGGGNASVVRTKGHQDCEEDRKQQKEDLRVAALASSGGPDAPEVKSVHLTYVHIHGHIDHYYHFLHDALLTFFPLFTTFANAKGAPTIARVVLWGQQSFGTFTPIFEAVYGVKVSTVACRCEPRSCAEVTTDGDSKGSKNLDAPLQLAGLYPFYFDEAIKFTQRRVLDSRLASSQKKPALPLDQSMLAPVARSSPSMMRADGQPLSLVGAGVSLPELPPGVGRIILLERLASSKNNTGLGAEARHHRRQLLSPQQHEQERLVWEKAKHFEKIRKRAGNSSASFGPRLRAQELAHVSIDRSQQRRTRRRLFGAPEAKGNGGRVQGGSAGASALHHSHTKAGSEKQHTKPYKPWEHAVNGSGRKVGIKNHRDLYAALVERFGEKRIVNAALESLPFPSQVRLFTEAEVVVGQHGAGLANVLFLKPGALVVELCPRLHVMYQHLARHRKAAYAFVDDCRGDNGLAFITADVPTVLATIETHLLGGSWEG